MRRKISAAIITKNEEHNIRRCLEAVKWVDEIVIVDSGSTDKTLDICREYGCKIIETGWHGFGPQKKMATDACSHDWVLSVDADEEVTPELAAEIQSLLEQEKLLAGYRIKWLSYYVTDWIRHSGWNRTWKTKLFDRTCGNFNDSLIHEKVVVKGEKANLRGLLKHHTYPDLDTVARKIDDYSRMGADMLRDKGKQSGLFSAYAHGFAVFAKMYLFNFGFLDGRIGLVLATNYAFATYYKYLRLWVDQRQVASGKGS